MIDDKDTDKWLEQLLRNSPALRDHNFSKGGFSESGFTDQVLQRFHQYRRRRRMILAWTWLFTLGALAFTLPWQQASLWLQHRNDAFTDFASKFILALGNNSQLNWQLHMPSHYSWVLMFVLGAIVWGAIVWGAIGMIKER